ncbi:cytochrome P450 [Virgibacillus xinjiangensis]|uniref:Cytochrome P450 n=1 Tax=Virgibacillus xinjiangensis TaxID=393090 RepID=A0ABV7CYX3_9BACI
MRVLAKTDTLAREKGFDHSFDLLREGYHFIPNRRHSFQSDMFETRLLGRRALCMGGMEAAELFYDNDLFKRSGAAPGMVRNTLLGKNSVQNLDGEMHYSRKKMFMSLMTTDRLAVMDEITIDQFEAALDRWEEQKEIVLYEEAKELMLRIACNWAGVPLWSHEVSLRKEDVASMIEGAASLGRKHWKARKARTRSEKWIGSLVEKVRQGVLSPPEKTALHTISLYRDINGELLDVHTAAEEILNIIRPMVAIAVYINFTALAVHQYPEEREKLKSGDEKQNLMFVQEVRRFYPFFPFQAAKAKQDFTWKGFEIRKNDLVLMDFYGTNHDPKRWGNPQVFNPDRFANWEENPFDFVPQGGGDYNMGHRCAGEWVTVQVMQIALDYLVNKMSYHVPQQDLSYSLVNFPTRSNSRFIMNDIVRKAQK